MSLESTREVAEFDPLSGDFSAPSAPQPTPPKNSPNPPSPKKTDAFTTADLSKIIITKDEKKKEKKKKEKKKIMKKEVVTSSALFGGNPDDEDDLFTTLRPKIEHDSFEQFLRSDPTSEKDTVEDNTPVLFDDDSDNEYDEKKKREGTKGGTGAYLKRMLQEDNEEDDVLESISDLKVAGLLSTKVDTAGGLIEEGDGTTKARRATVDKTDESLLAVREDDDLEQLMAATQVKISTSTAAEGDDDLEQLMAATQVKVLTSEGDDDDLFDLMGGGDDEDGNGEGGGDGDFNFDSYLSNNTGNGGCGLFD